MELFRLNRLNSSAEFMVWKMIECGKTAAVSPAFFIQVRAFLLFCPVSDLLSFRDPLLTSVLLFFDATW